MRRIGGVEQPSSFDHRSATFPPEGRARKDAYAYLSQLLVDLQQAGPVDLGPAHAACVAVVLNLGDGVHGVVAKGLQVVCVCVRVIGVIRGVCFSSLSSLEKIVIALLIPRPKADSQSVLGFVPKRGLFIMWGVRAVTHSCTTAVALVYDMDLKTTGATGRWVGRDVDRHLPKSTSELPILKWLLF